jgi:hypothetical protein
MTHETQTVDQHILQYESHLKHIDELLERAHKLSAICPEPELREHLAHIKPERDRLANIVTAVQQNPTKKVDEDLATIGPMAIWDIIAQDLEKLVERFER